MRTLLVWVFMPLGRGRLLHCFFVVWVLFFSFSPALQPQISLSLHLPSSLYLLSADSIREPPCHLRVQFYGVLFSLISYCYEQAWLDRDPSARAIWTDPPLSLVEFAAQLLPVFDSLLLRAPHRRLELRQCNNSYAGWYYKNKAYGVSLGELAVQEIESSIEFTA